MQLLAILSCALASICCLHVAEAANLTNFVLVGSTGDLARKYVWEALFVGFVENTFDQNIRIYGAATRPSEQGTSIIQGYISNLHCKDTWTVDQCTEGFAKFRNIVQYIQLKTESDFRSLQTTLSIPTIDPVTDTNVQEVLRVFYLSVSPSLYDSLASSINQFVRPDSTSTEMRVVFEKPFGRDLSTARALSERLGYHLHEEEIFRVDHYLGKVGMKAIIEFRKRNLPLLQALGMPSGGAREVDSIAVDALVNGDSMISMEEHKLEGSSVKVLMKEKEDTAGRSSYYDEYGVIRDVFQNHLTQAVVYSLMHIKPHITDTFGALDDRLAILKALAYSNTYLPMSDVDSTLDSGSSTASSSERECVVIPRMSPPSLWLGQYDGYRQHLKEDHIEYKRRRDENAHIDPQELVRVQSSVTPTAAAVNFSLDLSTTRVSVTVAGGKALNKREMVVTVGASGSDPCTIVYGVQGSPSSHLDEVIPSSATTASGPFIIMQGQCWSDVNHPDIILPDGWTVDPDHCVKEIQDRISSTINHRTSTYSTTSYECLSRPLEYLDESRGDDIDKDEEGERIARSSKYLNNAYIQIIGALMTNDRSYFTTTEELHSQWALWEPALRDAACARHKEDNAAHHSRGVEPTLEIVVEPYQKDTAAIV